MRKFNFIWLFIFLVQHSNESLFQFPDFGFSVGPDCITLKQLDQGTRKLCASQRENKTLWDEIIACHRPMTDEFMRSSAEALCPNPKHVEDPTDEKHTMAEVFFNICGLVEGSVLQKIGAFGCITLGSTSDGILSHSAEVKVVKEKWGDALPCKIGKCIIAKLGLV